MKKVILLLLSCLTHYCYAQDTLNIPVNGGAIKGIHLSTNNKSTIAVIVAGSGPTDMDGNSTQDISAQTYKLLAQELQEQNIASFRYDKRGAASGNSLVKKESDILFDYLINDLKSIVIYLKQIKKYKKVVLIGHSEGSLVSILSMDKANALISLAGPGKNSAQKIKEQLQTKLPDSMHQYAVSKIDSLYKGYSVNNDLASLNILFRASVQPYLISWFKHDPALAISKIKKPILIINGSNDLQVTTEDASLLHKANAQSKLLIIPYMNHCLKTIAGDEKENLNSYKNPALPVNLDLVDAITGFINKLKP